MIFSFLIAIFWSLFFYRSTPLSASTSRKYRTERSLHAQRVVVNILSCLSGCPISPVFQSRRYPAAFRKERTPHDMQDRDYLFLYLQVVISLSYLPQYRCSPCMTAAESDHTIPSCPDKTPRTPVFVLPAAGWLGNKIYSHIIDNPLPASVMYIADVFFCLHRTGKSEREREDGGGIIGIAGENLLVYFSMGSGPFARLVACKDSIIHIFAT